MIKLNLITNNKEQERIKEYLENNVSEILAMKIENGVKIEKDNKTLINKKDLNGFWKFACVEAKKQAEKGSNGAYVDDETVFGWAIHYFEEDSIEGNLYNEDGTEYKISPIKTTTPKAEMKKEKTKQENKQATLFDLMDLDNKEEQEEMLEKTENPNIITTEQNISIDTNTGEIIAVNADKSATIDKESVIMLYTLLDGKLEVKND